MGKKSRVKKERRESQEKHPATVRQERPAEKPTGIECFLLWIVRLSVALAMFTPLILNSRFYFPFVGPKSLFFMGLCEIAFFSWLILALNYKPYRPKINHVLTVLVVFLIVLILSSILGIDFSRSFWSKYERMTGLLMWFHLFGFFLVLSSTFKKASDWKRLFAVSVLVSVIISSLALLGYAGIKALDFSKKAGATMGNTSFMGSYLLFNVFFALYLFFRPSGFPAIFEKKHYLPIRIYCALAILLGVGATFVSSAKAALLAILGGFVLIFLLYLSFGTQRKPLKIAGRIILAVSCLCVLAALIMLFIPDSFVKNRFVEVATYARFVNWRMAWYGFLEKPLFGWGPENYTITFTRFFHPCLFTQRCGGEIWFDRSHNIVFDTLVTTGIVGFISYFGLLFLLLCIFAKKYLKEKSISFWTFSIFFSLIIAYVVQNLTVFDMVNSLVMLIMVAGFCAFIVTARKEADREGEHFFKRKILSAILVLLLIVCFSEFVVGPLRKGALVINALKARTLQERLAIYQKTEEVSPLGKYQIRDFFAQNSLDEIQRNIRKISENESAIKGAMEEMEIVARQLEKSIKESPLDFRSTLKLAQVYNLYSLFDNSKLPLAEQYALKALQLSPRNQQSYWTLAQTRVYQSQPEAGLELAQAAIELEPNWPQSYRIAIQIADLSGNDEKVKEILQEALDFNPQWEEEFREYIDKPL